MSQTAEERSEAVGDGLRGYLAAFLSPAEAAREAARLLQTHPFAQASELLSVATTTLVRDHGAPRDVILDVLTQDLGLSARAARVVITQPWGIAEGLERELPPGLFAHHPTRVGPDLQPPTPGLVAPPPSPAPVAASHRDGPGSRRSSGTPRRPSSALLLVTAAAAVLLLAVVLWRPDVPGPVGAPTAPDTTAVLANALSTVAAPDGSPPDDDTTTFGAGPVVLWVRVQVDEATTLTFRWNTPDGRTHITEAQVPRGTAALVATLPSAQKAVPGTYGVQVTTTSGRVLLVRTFEVIA